MSRKYYKSTRGNVLLCYYATTSPQHSYFYYDDFAQRWIGSSEEVKWIIEYTWGDTLSHLCHQDVVFQKVSPLEVLLAVGSIPKGRNKKINVRHNKA